MYPPDSNKITFITDSTNYCYNVTPFGLKNAGATYQRLMNTIFRNQIEKNVEVYIDDMVVNYDTLEQHMADLGEIFEQLCKYQVKLNLDKCTFGVDGRKFIGFMLTSRGIEANP